MEIRARARARVRNPLTNKYNNEIKYKQHNFDGAKSTKLKIK